MFRSAIECVKTPRAVRFLSKFMSPMGLGTKYDRAGEVSSNLPDQPTKFLPYAVKPFHSFSPLLKKVYFLTLYLSAS